METSGYYHWLKAKDAISITLWLPLSFRENFHFSDHLTEPYLLGVFGAWVWGQMCRQGEAEQQEKQHITGCWTVWPVLLICRTYTYVHTYTHKYSSHMSGERLWPRTNSSVSFAIEYESFIRDPRMVRKRKHCIEWPVKIGVRQPAKDQIRVCVYVSACVPVLTLRKCRHE